jgi:hypothetical protein
MGQVKQVMELALLAVLKLENQLVVPDHAEFGSRDPFYIAAIALECRNFDAQLLILPFELADFRGQFGSLAGQLQHVQDATIAEQGETKDQSHQSQRP